MAQFLLALLDIHIESPEAIELTNTELSPNYIDDKLSRFDLRVKLPDQSHIEIEIQLQDKSDMIPRGLYYQAKLFADQLSKGMEYHSLAKAITLNILDFNILEEESYLNRFRYCNTENGNELSDLCEINFLELKKVSKKWYNESEIQFMNYHLTDKEMWSIFLATDNEEVIDMLAKDNEAINKAVEKLKYVSADDIERFRIDQIEKARMDYYSDMKANFREGVEEGKKEKSLQIAKKLLHDYDNEEIHELTGLSIELIESLRFDN